MTLHGLLPFSKRQMALFGPVIEALVRPMFKAGRHVRFCCPVEAQLIGDDPFGSKAIALH